MNKDVYEYLMNFADDKTILNMLSVNKKFNDEYFFEKILKRRYPLLTNFKHKAETWRSFYIKMIYYIDQIFTRYGIPYIADERYNPRKVYRELTSIEDLSHNEVLIDLILYATAVGNLSLTKYLYNKTLMRERSNIRRKIVYEAAKNGHLNIMKEFIEGLNFPLPIFEAAEAGHIDIVKYILEKEHNEREINNALVIAAGRGYINIVKLLLKNGANFYDYAAVRAANSKHFNIVELLIDKVDSDYILREILREAIKSNVIHTLELILEKQDLHLDLYDALSEAAKSNNLSIVKLLLNYITAPFAIQQALTLTTDPSIKSLLKSYL